MRAGIEDKDVFRTCAKGLPLGAFEAVRSDEDVCVLRLNHDTAVTVLLGTSALSG
jgi:hypothetical protein